MLLTALLGSAALSAASPPVKKVQARLVPATGLLDTPLTLEASGLQPHGRVGLELSARDNSGRLWKALLSAKADSRGTLRRDVSRSLASLRPANRHVSPTMTSLVPPGRGLAVVVELTVGGRIVAAARGAVRSVRSPDVVVHTLTLDDDKLVGRYWTRRGASSGPAVLLLGGAEGGFSGDVTASLLASHGYRTLQLAYFGLKGLPPTLARIQLEYFETALRWLGAQPGVLSGHVVALGGSRGGELALMLATRFPEMVTAVAAYAPSSVVNPAPDCISAAWIFTGRPIPHVDCDEFGVAKPRKKPEAVIPVEKIRGPIFLVAGGADSVLPSESYATAIRERAKRFGKVDLTTLIYRRAGHAIGVKLPYLPQATILVSGRGGIDTGGETLADARARTDAWFELLRFLRRAM